MQARLRKLDKKRAGSDASDSDSDADDRPTKKRSGPSLLDQELAKYSSARRTKGKRGKRDEDDILSALSNFAGKIRQAEGGEAGDEKAGEELEIDDDVDWIGHTLKAAKDDGSESRRAESDYTVSGFVLNGVFLDVIIHADQNVPCRSSILVPKQEHSKANVEKRNSPLAIDGDEENN